MKNKLTDLNDHLFAQIERLSEEGLTDDQIKKECARGAVIVGLADQIVRAAAIKIQAAKIASDHGIDPSRFLDAAIATKQIEGRPK